MSKMSKKLILALAMGLSFGVGSQGAAADNARARLKGFAEVPAVSTAAKGHFTASIDVNASTISYELSYEDLEGKVAQAHIHFGQKGVNGGISVFLCSNLGNGPAGTQACPASPATISGTIKASDVIGPAGQGISSGEFAELLEAIEEKVAYVNVHSDIFPTGEIRGQLR